MSKPQPMKLAKSKCWDCGSPYEDHHTLWCDLAPQDAHRDLPQHPGTQWWTGAISEERVRELLGKTS